MARLDLTRDQLERADAWYSHSRWGGHHNATLLLKNIAEAQRPPSDPSLHLEWAHKHVCHSGMKGAERCFKVCDLVYPETRFEAWPCMAAWLKLMGDGRVKLTYEEGIGFGLCATAAFTKGERVVPGTTSTRPEPAPARALMLRVKDTCTRT